MATKQRIRSEQTQAQTVTELFPTSVSTEQTSMSYMKRLTAVAVSNVLYLRNVFSEECYGHRKLDSLKLRILTEKCETVAAKEIVQWVKGSFDAMEKKYLRQLTLGIYTDPHKPDEVIEAYSFRFGYKSNQINITLSKGRTERVIEETANQDLRLTTTQLLRSLIVMVQSLDKLPNECYLNMKLLYYDDITPEDYEPPGFVAADSPSFTFNGKPIVVTAGGVDTPFHSLKVKVSTNQQQFQDWESNPNSGTNGSQNMSQELIDECTPLDINDRSDQSLDSEPPIDRKSCEKKQKTENSLKNSSKESLKENIKDPFRSLLDTSDRNCRQMNAENKVISKIKDLRVEDNNNSLAKRKRESIEFEVTQDSMFRSSANNDKKLKASQTNKRIPIKR